MVDLLSDNDIEIYVTKEMLKNLDKVGDVIVKNIRRQLVTAIQKNTNLTKEINYKIRDNGIFIYSDSPVPKFLDEGTRPHIIRPKIPGGVLKFQSEKSGTRKDGSRYNIDDWTATKEVHHPGFEARPFITMGLHLSKNQIKNELFNSPTFTKTP